MNPGFKDLSFEIFYFRTITNCGLISLIYYEKNKFNKILSIVISEFFYDKKKTIISEKEIGFTFVRRLEGFVIVF